MLPHFWGVSPQKWRKRRIQFGFFGSTKFHGGIFVEISMPSLKALFEMAGGMDAPAFLGCFTPKMEKKTNSVRLFRLYIIPWRDFCRNIHAISKSAFRDGRGHECTRIFGAFRPKNGEKDEFSSAFSSLHNSTDGFL